VRETQAATDAKPKKQRSLLGHLVTLSPCHLVIFCVVLPLLPVQAGEKEEPLEDPVPLRRVLVPPHRVAAELDRVGQGILVQMPRADFEARVQKAARVGQVLKNAPKLIEANYRAGLEGTALVGSGDWTVLNPLSVPGIWSLSELNLALSKVKLEAVDALLGGLGKSLGLYLEKSGKQTVVFDWSARGARITNGLHFELKAPPCAVALLELKLPADHLVTIPRNGGLLSGPHEAENPKLRLWRLRFSGRSQIEFDIRRTAGSDLVPPLVLATLQTRQQLTPSRLLADFEFQVEVLHQSVRKLLLECDAALKPYEVTLRNVHLKWKIHQPEGSKGTNLLVVTLPEPFLGPLSLRVRCTAHLAGSGTWASPGLRLLKALPWAPPDGSDKLETLGDPRLVTVLSQGETLKLQVAPDIQLEGWQPGDFRVVKTADLDGSQVLTLLEGGLTGSPQLDVLPTPRKPFPRRPQAKLKMQGTALRVRQFLWWQLGPDGDALTVQTTYEVLRGSLFLLPLKLPAGWRIESVNLDPPEVLLNWTRDLEKNRTVLYVDLQKPLTPQRSGKLTVQLHKAAETRLPRVVPPTGLTLPFPAAEPLDPCLYEGALGIQVDPYYQATPLETSAPATLPPVKEPHGTPPWDGETLSFYFPFRTQVSSAQVAPGVTGKLRLLPHQTRLQARCQSEVILAAGRAAVLVRLTLEASGGSLQSVDLHFSAPVSDSWSWTIPAAAEGKGESAKSAARPVLTMQRVRAEEVAPQLLALGGSNILSTTGLLTTAPRGQRWRLTLARPLRERQPLVLEARVDLSPRSTLPAELAGALTLINGNNLFAPTAVILHAVGPGGKDAPPTLQDWEVPLIAVPAADRLLGEVTLHLTQTDLVHLQAEGLQEVGRSEPAGRKKDSVREAWRTFRYSDPSTPWGGPRLSLRSKALPGERSAEEICDRCDLTTTLEPGGRLVHHLRFRVWNWRNRLLPVRLPPGARLLAARTEDRGGIQPVVVLLDTGVREVQLPVATGKNVHHFEIVYVSGEAATLGAPWTNLQAPAPELPVRPIAFRRLWRLPPGLVPLFQDRLRHLPGPAQSTPQRSWWAKGESLWQSADSLIALAGFADAAPSWSDEWAEQQQQRLTQAWESYRKRHRGTTVTLGAFLDNLALDHLGGTSPLVVDRGAFREAGVSRETPLHLAKEETPAALPWQSIGLVYVPSRAAPLLTTKRQRDAWLGARGDRPLSSSLEEAIAQAARYGYDTTGRFHTVADWLSHSEEDPGWNDPGSLASSLTEADWTEWEPLAGIDTGEIVVVREELGLLLGLALTVVLSLILWRSHALLSRRWRFRLLLIWVALAGLALFWLPAAVSAAAWWPLLLGVAIAVGWYLSWHVKLPPAPSRKEVGSSAKGVAAALVLALACLSTLAQGVDAPGPGTVLLLPGPKDAPEKQTALVSPELLKQLDTLIQRGASGSSGAVLLSARYEGKINGDVADCKAEFQVHCFDEQATLNIPLGGVKLKEGTLLRGAPAYPVALPAASGPGTPAGPSGYRLLIKGRGQHVLIMPFTVGVVSTGQRHDLRLSIPPLAQSWLSLELPPGTRSGQVPSALGSQKAIPLDSPKNGKSPAVRLEAQLGRERNLHVRWWQDNQPGQKKTLKVQEAYLWELRPGGSNLAAVLQYTIAGGPVDRLFVGLPVGLEVRGVDVGLWKTLPEGTPAPRLKGWRIVEPTGQRRLLVEFQTPVRGAVQLTLELVPRVVLGPGVLPLPVLKFTSEVALGEGTLAYRVEKLEAIDKSHNLILSPITPKAFTEVWQQAGMGGVRPPTRAYTFRRGPGNGSLVLTLQGPPLKADQQQLLWQVAPRFADLHLKLKVQAAPEELALLEWEVPPEVVVARVSGSSVRYWTRSGTHVQVWLKAPRGVTTSDSPITLELSGWTMLSGNAAPGGARDFVLPIIRLPGARSLTTTVQVAAGPGVKVEPVEVDKLTRTASPNPSLLTYQTEHILYKGRFRVQPTPLPADLAIVTGAEVSEGQLHFVSRLSYQPPPGKGNPSGLVPSSATLRLRHWEGNVQVAVTGGTVKELPSKERGERVWNVTLPRGDGQRLLLRLTGKASLSGAAKVLMPDVNLEFGAVPVRRRRWVVAGENLRAQEVTGLALAKDVPRELPAGEPDPVFPISSAWRVTADNWRLVLVPRPTVALPVTALFAEQKSEVVSGRRWLHQATYLLHIRAGSELRLTLPESANVLALTLDGNQLTPRQTGPGQLWLPLPGESGVHTLRLLWTFPEGGETLEEPRLDQPQLKGVASPPAVWIVQTPPGYRLARPPLDRAIEALSAAGVELRRAEAELTLSGVLAEGASSPLSSADPRLEASLKRFYRHCRSAERLLTLFPSVVADNGPRGQSLSQWLGELRQQALKLAQTHHFDKLRIQAEKQAQSMEGTSGAAESTSSGPLLLSLPERGTPSYWRSSEQDPRFVFRSLQQRQTREALTASVWLLVLVLLVGVLSYFPRVVAWLQAFWPEEVALLAWLGWQAYGFSWIGLVLVIVAGYARVLWLMHWIPGLLHRKPPAPAATGSGAPSGS
jgi:hypothetical protein